MIKKLCITVLISALMLNMGAFAKESKSMTRQEIADKNLETLFKDTIKRTSYKIIINKNNLCTINSS